MNPIHEMLHGDEQVGASERAPSRAGESRAEELDQFLSGRWMGPDDECAVEALAYA